MASDRELFPEAVNDFVFDLHDASRRSFIPSEQQSLYQVTFREITTKVSKPQAQQGATQFYVAYLMLTIFI